MYGEIGHGPWCSGLPYPPVPIGPNSFKDGTDIDERPPTSPAPTRLGQLGIPAWAASSPTGPPRPASAPA